MKETDIRPQDVVLGRGGNAYKHPGNNELRELAKSFAHSYVKASKSEKFQISKRMLHVAMSSNPPARFLRKTEQSNRYEEVDYDIAREKVCQCLRDATVELKLRPGGTSTAAAKCNIDSERPNVISSIGTGSDICSVDSGKGNISQSEPQLVYSPNPSMHYPPIISPDTNQGSSNGRKLPFDPYPQNQVCRDHFIPPPPPCYHPSSVVPSYPSNTPSYYHSPNMWYPNQHPQYPHHYQYNHQYPYPRPSHHYKHPILPLPIHDSRDQRTATRTEDFSLPRLTTKVKIPDHSGANEVVPPADTYHCSDDDYVNLVSSMSSDYDNMKTECIDDLDLCYCKSTSRSIDSIDSFSTPFENVLDSLIKNTDSWY